MTDNKIRIDLGGGEYPREGFLNIDISKVNELNGNVYTPDICHDLNDGIPFPDDFVDEVSSSHFMEHAKDPVFLMNEIVRVCKNDSKVTIVVPVHCMIPGHITDMSFEWFNKNKPKELKITYFKQTKKDIIDYAGKPFSFEELWLEMKVRK